MYRRVAGPTLNGSRQWHILFFFVFFSRGIPSPGVRGSEAALRGGLAPRLVSKHEDVPSAISVGAETSHGLLLPLSWWLNPCTLKSAARDGGCPSLRGKQPPVRVFAISTLRNPAQGARRSASRRESGLGSEVSLQSRAHRAVCQGNSLPRSAPAQDGVQLRGTLKLALPPRQLLREIRFLSCPRHGGLGLEMFSPRMEFVS